MTVEAILKFGFNADEIGKIGGDNFCSVLMLPQSDANNRDCR